jgi:choline dehydrogenase-like flavoprotein
MLAMGSTVPEYDFIVVGGTSLSRTLSSKMPPNLLTIITAGPSGCALAARLAQSPKRPSVLLLEAGSGNKGAEYLVPADRFTLAFKEPSMNWGYKTAPQTHLKGQEIDYSRGRGLGGSTAINFSCWVIGPDADYDEWARVVGDEDFGWAKVKERYKRVENYHVEVPEENRRWVDVRAEGKPVFFFVLSCSS